MGNAISIIICTRNKADSLRETLRALSTVNIPAGLSAEVIVADNGSTDHTPQVAEAFAASQQKLLVRHILIPTPGQSRARNAGIATANGDIILFTDDDVRPPSNWVEGMCRPILDGKADATTSTTIVAEHLRRPWMGPLHLGYLAAPPPAPEGPLSEAWRFIGASMAFSRRVLEKVPGFHTRLGPGALGFADDSLFGMQISRAGFRIWNVRDCEPVHHFEPTRLSRAAFLRRARGQGLSWGYIAHHWMHEDHSWAELAKQWLRLQHARATVATVWPHAEGAAEEELNLLADFHLLRQFFKERLAGGSNSGLPD